MGSFTFPPPLAPGDRVHVVAPSSPLPRAELLRGLAWMRDRYEVTARTSLLSRLGYLAGDDDSRALALSEAMTDPHTKAIFVARGGYGAMRIVDRLPWGAFARAPKWIVGFSDVTALHAEAMARGLASVHAPNVTGLAAIHPWTRGRFLRAIERPQAPVEWSDLRVVRHGRGEGEIVGGNLSLVAAMAAAGRWHAPPGAILAIEEITERPYRLDRMLTSLRLGGHLASLAGVVVGELTQCEPGPDGVTAHDVIADLARSLRVPVVAGAPFGHGARNDAFTLGARARIEGDRVVIG